MENSKLAVSNKPSLETLKEGDTLMVSIRKVYHTKGDASKGYKASIELAQFIENPDRPTSAISMLNEGDERFASKKAQHAYQPVSDQVAFNVLKFRFLNLQKQILKLQELRSIHVQV